MSHSTRIDLAYSKWPLIKDVKNTYLFGRKPFLTETYFGVKRTPSNAKWDQAMRDMEWLAHQMHARGHATDNSLEDDVPAGYTYLAQMIAHDLTLNAQPLSTEGIAPPTRGVQNKNSPVLDLDMIYRGGPVVSPMLYEPLEKNDAPKNRTRLKIGWTRQNYDGRPEPTRNDLPRSVPCPVAPSGSEPILECLVGDERNQENLILAQLVVQFHKLHNYYVGVIETYSWRNDQYIPPREVFNLARQATTETYHGIIAHDFLPTITGSAAHTTAADVGDVRCNDPNAGLPVEFSIGVFRLFHSMVRQRYVYPVTKVDANGTDLITGIEVPPTKQLLDYRQNNNQDDLKIPLASKWVVSDWSFFFPAKDNTGNKWIPGYNKARRITASIAPVLFDSYKFPANDHSPSHD